MGVILVASLLFTTGLVTWLVLKLVQFIRDVRAMRKAVASFASLPCHWILGTYPTIKKIGRENFLNLLLEVTKKRKSKALVFWKTSIFPIVICVHPDTISEILRTSCPKNRRFGGGYDKIVPWLGEGLLLSYNPRWERNRKLLTPAFHFNILKPYVNIYNTAAEILLGKFQKAADSGLSYNICHPVGLYTLDIMLKCACSYDGGIQSEGTSHPYQRAIWGLSQIVEERLMNPLHYFDTIFYRTSKGKEFQRLCRYVHQFAEDIIEKRRESLAQDKDLLLKRHPDFLDILLTARDEDNVGLSTEDIRAEVDTFLFEGHDTTASAISWSLYALAKYPDLQERVYQEISHITGDSDHVNWDNLSELHHTTAFLKEALRMYSPVPHVGRTLSKPLTIDGAELPVGMVVTVPIHVLHHNPEVWENPEEFIPERFEQESFSSRDPYSYVPFSAGPRNCIGQNFAMNEEKVVVSRILKRFRIAVDPDHDVKMVPSMVMRARNGIKLKFIARNGPSA